METASEEGRGSVGDQMAIEEGFAVYGADSPVPFASVIEVYEERIIILSVAYPTREFAQQYAIQIGEIEEVDLANRSIRLVLTVHEVKNNPDYEVGS